MAPFLFLSLFQSGHLPDIGSSHSPLLQESPAQQLAPQDSPRFAQEVIHDGAAAHSPATLVDEQSQGLPMELTMQFLGEWQMSPV